MFGSTFSFGFSIGDVVTQITGLLGNPLVLGLVTAFIAAGMSGRLVRFVKRMGDSGDFEYYDEPQEPHLSFRPRQSLTHADMDAMNAFNPAYKSGMRKSRRDYTQTFGRGKKFFRDHAGTNIGGGKWRGLS